MLFQVNILYDRHLDRRTVFTQNLNQQLAVRLTWLSIVKFRVQRNSLKACGGSVVWTGVFAVCMLRLAIRVLKLLKESNH